MAGIIRCKDCKWYHKAWDGTEKHFFESYWCEWVEPDEDDFCSLAEPKEESVKELVREKAEIDEFFGEDGENDGEGSKDEI